MEALMEFFKELVNWTCSGERTHTVVTAGTWPGHTFVAERYDSAEHGSFVMARIRTGMASVGRTEKIAAV